MGQLPIYGQEAANAFHRRYGPRGNSLEPPEDNDDGCPGAWYRCEFASSVATYERTIMSGGVASNPLLDRCDDPLVIEAAMFVEGERMRHRNHWESKFRD